MIRWLSPSYDGDRRIAISGTVEVGAIFPPIGSDRWRWRMWIGSAWPKEGREPTELAAKVALDRAWAGFLNQANLAERGS